MNKKKLAIIAAAIILTIIIIIVIVIVVEKKNNSGSNINTNSGTNQSDPNQPNPNQPNQPNSTYTKGQDQSLGGDYKQINNIMSGQGCMQACLADPVCRAWAWVNNSYPTVNFRNICYLKNGTPTPKANQYVDSGVITR